jgi:hypothetical protein
MLNNLVQAYDPISFQPLLECQFSTLEHDIKHSLVVATGSVLDLFHANHSRDGITVWKSWRK